MLALARALHIECFVFLQDSAKAIQQYFNAIERLLSARHTKQTSMLEPFSCKN